MNIAASAKINAIIDGKTLPLGILLPDSVTMREIYRNIYAVVFVEHGKQTISVPRSIDKRFIGSQPTLSLITQENLPSIQYSILAPIVQLITEVDISNKRLDKPPQPIKDQSILPSNADSYLFLHQKLYDIYPITSKSAILPFLIHDSWKHRNTNRDKIIIYAPQPIDTALFNVQIISYILAHYKAISLNPLSQPFHKYQKYIHEMSQSAKCMIFASSNSADIYITLLLIASGVPVIAVNNSFLQDILRDGYIEYDRAKLRYYSKQDFDTMWQLQYKIIEQKYITNYNDICVQWIDYFKRLNKPYIELS